MKKVLFTCFILSVIVCGIVVCKNGGKPNGPDGPDVKPNPPAVITYSEGPHYPHDTSSFTEGLLIYKGDLYEGTGDPDYTGKSKLLKVDLKTGKPLKSVSLDKKYFGEGIVILHDTIYQLTYKEKTGFMYTLDFKPIKEFQFAAPEGWGMTTDGKEIIASDGSSNLYYYEPSTFRLLRTQSITEEGGLINNINELEYIDGFIYANQWQTAYILKIDPSNGQVVGKSDLSRITDRIKSDYPYADFLNGIAYDASTKKIYVTGKKWPEIYEIQFSQ